MWLFRPFSLCERPLCCDSVAAGADLSPKGACGDSPLAGHAVPEPSTGYSAEAFDDVVQAHEVSNLTHCKDALILAAHVEAGIKDGCTNSTRCTTPVFSSSGIFDATEEPGVNYAMKDGCADSNRSTTPVFSSSVVSDAPAEAGACVEAEAQLQALRSLLMPGELDSLSSFLVPGEMLDDCLLRFLRWKGMKANQAANALKADIAWRKRMQPAQIADMPPEELLGVDRKLIQRYLPTWHQGFDRMGRPVIFSQYGRFRFQPVLAQTTIDQLIQLHVHNAERAARLCGMQSLRFGRAISQVVTVVDGQHFDPHTMCNKAAFHWAQQMAIIDEEHYADRLGNFIIINAPKGLCHFWKLLKFLVPKSKSQKVELYAGREQWLPRLLELIDPDVIPAEYGGSGANGGLLEP